MIPEGRGDFSRPCGREAEASPIHFLLAGEGGVKLSIF